MYVLLQQASDLLSKTASRLQHLDTTEVNPAKQQAVSIAREEEVFSATADQYTYIRYLPFPNPKVFWKWEGSVKYC